MGRGYDRRAVSRGWKGDQFPVPIGSKEKARSDVFTGQIGKILEDILFAHTRSEIFQNVIDRDAQSTDAGLAAPLARINADEVFPVHECQRSVSAHKDQALASSAGE